MFSVPVRRTSRLPKSRKSYSILADQLPHRPHSTPVPTIQPQRLLSALVKELELTLKPSVVRTLILSDDEKCVFAQAAPPFTNHSVRSCGPEVTPNVPAMVAMSLTWLETKPL